MLLRGGLWRRRLWTSRLPRQVRRQWPLPAGRYLRVLRRLHRHRLQHRDVRARMCGAARRVSQWHLPLRARVRRRRLCGAALPIGLLRPRLVRRPGMRLRQGLDDERLLTQVVPRRLQRQRPLRGRCVPLRRRLLWIELRRGVRGREWFGVLGPRRVPPRLVLLLTGMVGRRLPVAGVFV